MLFYNVTRYTNSLLSCICVSITNLLFITCTLVAIGEILGGLKCMTIVSCLRDWKATKVIVLACQISRVSTLCDSWSEMTLNYQMMVEKYPNLKEEVGGSIPDCKIFSLLEEKYAKWSIASCALALTCRPSFSKK